MSYFDSPQKDNATLRKRCERWKPAPIASFRGARAKLTLPRSRPSPYERVPAHGDRPNVLSETSSHSRKRSFDFFFFQFFKIRFISSPSALIIYFKKLRVLCAVSLANSIANVHSRSLASAKRARSEKIQSQRHCLLYSRLTSAAPPFGACSTIFKPLLPVERIIIVIISSARAPSGAANCAILFWRVYGN